MCKGSLALALMAVMGVTMFGGQVLAVGQGVPPLIIQSPDGNIRFRLETIDGGLGYAVSFGQTPVILPSALGLVIDGVRIGRGATLQKVTRYRLDEAYPVMGVHRMAHNYCNGAAIDFLSPTVPFRIEVNVYDDGIAFRYVVTRKGETIIGRDSTSFVLPAATVVWSQPNIKYYEGQYTKKNIEDCKGGELAGPPVTLELPGAFAAITEGGLVDFSGMSLVAVGNNTLMANLSGATRKTGKIASSWRIIEIGKDLNTLVNCDIVTDVSAAPDRQLFPNGSRTGWIKPGRSVWSWLAAEHDVTLANMKHFTDMAAQLGFEYNLVDDGWGKWHDGDRDNWDMMKELVDYSAKKGIKIWVWKAYPDRDGIPGINTPEKRRAFFKRCKDIGVTGLKIDFFDSEAQEIVDFYQAALKDAAADQLMMDFHGANKPTGENRTWPNELTREAIRGLENSPPWAPGNTTLPFTRYLAGPADFTPLHFGDRLGEISWAQQVATTIVFTSPLLCLGVDPGSLLANPCREMIQSVPTVWDETIVLPPSKIGELAIDARRKGRVWYIAGINGSADPRAIDLPVAFLKRGTWSVSSLEDDPKTQANVILRNSSLSPDGLLHLSMNGFGGYVCRIQPAD